MQWMFALGGLNSCLDALCASYREAPLTLQDLSFPLSLHALAFHLRVASVKLSPLRTENFSSSASGLIEEGQTQRWSPGYWVRLLVLPCFLVLPRLLADLARAVGVRSRGSQFLPGCTLRVVPRGAFDTPRSELSSFAPCACFSPPGGFCETVAIAH